MTKRVLIVDDEEDIREYLSTVLKKNGYEPLVAENGMEGLNKAKEEKPDLIVLDIMMPEKSGISVLYELRRDDSLNDIPVIILSAVQSFIEQARKEIDSEEILMKMKALLDNPDSKVEKFFLHFRSYRHMLLLDKEETVDKYRQKKTIGIPAIPDIFIDKPVDPESFVKAVNILIGPTE